MLWLKNFDFFNVVKTMIIGISVVAIVCVLFYYMWLKTKQARIPTSFGTNEYIFTKRTNYASRLLTLLFDFGNNEYWIEQTGLEGNLKRLLLFISYPRHHDYHISMLILIDHCFHCVFPHL
jgi:hypothetical protein